MYVNVTIRNGISFTKLQLPPEPVTRGLPPADLRLFCLLPSTEFVVSLPNKIPVYATDSVEIFSAYTQEVNLKVL